MYSETTYIWRILSILCDWCLYHINTIQRVLLEHIYSLFQREREREREREVVGVSGVYVFAADLYFVV